MVTVVEVPEKSEPATKPTPSSTPKPTSSVTPQPHGGDDDHQSTKYPPNDQTESSDSRLKQRVLEKIRRAGGK